MRYALSLIGALALAGTVVLTQAPAPQHPEHAAPATKKPAMTTSQKIAKAVSAGPSDITARAAVVEMDANGAQKELRAGSNGWVCMAEPEAMCIDKQWQAWADAWMHKTDPKVTGVGIAYMLRGDQGASNTDPFATEKTPTNDWIVSPPHVMVLTPDTAQLAALPSDPTTGGPWVMWKGTKYAHIMVPTTSMTHHGTEGTTGTKTKPTEGTTGTKTK